MTNPKVPTGSFFRDQVEAEMLKVNSDLDTEREIEEKWRRSGLHHSDARELLELMRVQPVGKVIAFNAAFKNPVTKALTSETRYFVLTPFKTVVEAETYIGTLHQRVLELSRLPNLENVGLFSFLKIFLKRKFGKSV